MNLEYTYLFSSFKEIVKNSTLISNFSVIQIIILIILIIGLFLWVYFLVPKSMLLYKKRQKTLKGKKKRKIINQILTQKEIEDEIEKEIKNM